MRIEAITLREIRMPLVHFFETSFGRTTERRILLTTLHTDGPEGWGECVAGEDPFYSEESVDTAWYGILGLIGWAYLVAALVFLVFRANRSAILGCMVLLMCLFVADKTGLFENFWLNRVVGIGETLGSQSAISVCGLLMGSMLTAADMTSLKARTTFTFWLAAGCAAAALLPALVEGVGAEDEQVLLDLPGLLPGLVLLFAELLAVLLPGGQEAVVLGSLGRVERLDVGLLVRPCGEVLADRGRHTERA